MEIKDIQKWERNFVRKKGISLDEKTASFIAISKLAEEVGETSKALLEGRWDEIQAEVADVIVFACKIANIAEDFHNTEGLSKVLEKKLGYCETRAYNKDRKKFNKPKNEEFK